MRLPFPRFVVLTLLAALLISSGFAREYDLLTGVLTLEHEKMTGQTGGLPLGGPGYNK